MSERGTQGNLCGVVPCTRPANHEHGSDIGGVAQVWYCCGSEECCDGPDDERDTYPDDDGGD